MSGKEMLTQIEGIIIYRNLWKTYLTIRSESFDQRKKKIGNSV
jgi:hypothetical protein